MNKSGGHGHGESEHGEHAEHVGDDDESVTEKPEGDEEASNGELQRNDQSGDTPEGESTSSGSDDRPRTDHSVQDAGQGSPETAGGEDPKAGAHEVESGSNVEGVRFKGATSGGTREGEQGDTRKHIPDAKGFNKKRIESDYGKEQGQLEGEDSSGTDKALILFAVNSGNLTDEALGCTFEAAKWTQHNLFQAGGTQQYQHQALYRHGQQS